MSVAEYGKRDLDERWMGLVGLLSALRAERIGLCRKVFSTWKDDEHTFHRPTLCQERELCPVCAWAYNEQLVADDLELYQLLCNQIGSRLGFAEVEFTLPFEGQRRVEDGNLGELRSLAFECLKEIMGEQGRFCIAGVGSTHHWHSNDPMKGWFPHVHFTVLEVAYDKLNDRFVRIPVHLSREYLERLNALWRQKFEKRFGRVKARRFVTHWHYGRGHAAMAHRLSYQFRRPVKDCYNAVMSTRSIEGLNLEWINRMLLRPKNEKRHQWYGWLSDGVKTRFLRKMDIERQKKSVRMKARSKVYCPLCGDELSCVGRGIPYEALTGLDRYNSVLAFGGSRGALLQWPK